MIKPILVLCLGNEVLTDDAFGPVVARRLGTMLDPCDRVEVIFAPVAGFSLLDLMHRRERVLVVDSIQTGNARAGTLHFFEMGQLTPSRNLTCSHQMSLPTALELGRKMGYEMPKQIDVLAVEVADVTTLGEMMTQVVEAAVEPALVEIETWVGEAKHFCKCARG